MTQFFHGLLAWPHAIMLKLPPGGWQVVQEMHFFYLQNKEMAQRKQQLSWGRFRQPRHACLNGGLQNPGGVSLATQRAREADGLLMKVIQKYFCTHHLRAIRPRDSVLTSAEVENYFPSRSPCCFPQMQFITSSLSAARSR